MEVTFVVALDCKCLQNREQEPTVSKQHGSCGLTASSCILSPSVHCHPLGKSFVSYITQKMSFAFLGQTLHRSSPASHLTAVTRNKLERTQFPSLTSAVKVRNWSHASPGEISPPSAHLSPPQTYMCQHVVHPRPPSCHSESGGQN
jgi:hypothetical protein